MKKIVPFALMIVLAGCAKKEWSKESVSKRCVKELEDKSEVSKALSKEKMVTICDCIGEKMVTNYKNETEANKDTDGAREIGTNCTLANME